MSAKFSIRLLLQIYLAICIVQISLGQNIAPGLDIKEYSKSAPYLISRSPIKLSKYLTERDSSNTQKALNIYTWIIHNIKYDFNQFEKFKNKNYNSKQTLRKRKAICDQYVNLFNALCSNAGISSREILGYSRGLSYAEGDTFYEVDHAWNGIKIDSVWYLVDATWGSGSAVQKKQAFKHLLYKCFKKPYIKNKYKFEPKPDYAYFMVKPEELIKDHLPADPTWQLLEYPISVQTFEQNCWKGYKNKIDSLYKFRVYSLDYFNKLNSYEFLSYKQYLTRTSKNAHDYNPKNNKLLSKAALLNANVFELKNKDYKFLIESNVASINNYKSAQVHAKKHRSTVNSESRQVSRSNEQFIKNELIQPISARLKNIHIQHTKNNRTFTDRKRIMEGFEKKLSKLQNTLDNTNFKSVNDVRYSKIAKPDILIKNKLRMIVCDSLINHFQDSLDRVFFETKELIRKNLNMQSNLQKQNIMLNQLILENISSIIENQDFTILSISISRIDSLRNQLEQLGSRMKINTDSFIKLSQSIPYMHSNIVSQIRIGQKLLLENCSLSKGKDCNETNNSRYNAGTENVYLEKIEIQKTMIKMKKLEYHHYSEINQILSTQSKLLNTNLKFLYLYNKKRIDGINYKKAKSSYEMNQIIEVSTRSIRLLENSNRNLKTKFREQRVQ